MTKLGYVLLAGVLLDVVSFTSLHHISKRTYGYGGRMRGGYRGGYGGFGRAGGYRGFSGGYGGLGGGGYGGGLNALTTALYSRILDGMYGGGLGGGFGGGFGGVQYIYVPVYVPVDDGTVVIVEEGGATDFGNGGPRIIDTGGGEIDIGGVGNEELLMYSNDKATTRVKVATQPQRVRIGRERVVQKSTELGLGRTYAFTPPRRTKGRTQQG